MSHVYLLGTLACWGVLKYVGHDTDRGYVQLSECVACVSLDLTLFNFDALPYDPICAF